MDLAQLDQWLADPATFPAAHGPVERIHTHASVVALVGDHVFKIKREVRHAFLDFSTQELRLRAAREELRLNRRLAPDLYHGLVVLRPRPGGARIEALAADAEPPADTLAVGVHMRRLSARHLLDRRLERGEVDHQLLGVLSERLARFHREAERGPEVDRAADPERLCALARDNLKALAQWTAPDALPAEGGRGALLSPRLVAALERASEEFFDAAMPLLRQRIAAGRAVDGHGDLHAGNVWVDGSQVQIYDALEFDADLRRSDGALDVAFLLMDLDRAGHRAAAQWLARSYQRASGDEGASELWTGFKTYRALVRAKVCGLRAAAPELSLGERLSARLEGQAFGALALSYHQKPALILMCGLPASGKSWLGERLARALGAGLHKSDVRRRQIALADGELPTGRHRGAYDQGRYAPDAKQRTYDALLEDARADLDQGRTSVIDGSFVQARWRAPFARMALDRGAPYLLLETHADRETTRERLERRALDPREPSEADWNVYLRLAEQYEPPTELPPAHHLRIESGGPAETAVVSVLDALVAQTIRDHR